MCKDCLHFIYYSIYIPPFLRAQGHLLKLLYNKKCHFPILELNNMLVT